jgi:hypothetical protein
VVGCKYRKKKNKGKKRTTANKSARHRTATKKKMAKKRARKKMRLRGKSQSVGTLAFEPEGLAARSGSQSGDLQGLSNIQGADSESVNELLEEGNAFEAEVVKVVQDAGDADKSEVTTHEVPQDDVPGEYDDKDRP